MNNGVLGEEQKRAGERRGLGGLAAEPRVLFGPSSAREHQHEDEAGGDNRGLQIQRQREVGGGTEEREEGGHYDPHCCRRARRHWRGDDANHLSGSRSARATTRTTRAASGPNPEHRRALNAEVASPASRNRTWGRTRMRLKEPAPPGYFCARMRRPLRFRNRTPSATSLRSLRRGLRRETEQSCRA